MLGNQSSALFQKMVTELQAVEWIEVECYENMKA